LSGTGSAAETCGCGFGVCGLSLGVVVSALTLVALLTSLPIALSLLLPLAVITSPPGCRDVICKPTPFTLECDVTCTSVWGCGRQLATPAKSQAEHISENG